MYRSRLFSSEQCCVCRYRRNRSMNGRERSLRFAGVALAAIVLASCGGGGSGGRGSDTSQRVVVDDEPPPGPGPNGSYLYVSGPEIYFGTRDVGTVASQELEIVNRGADIYPIESLEIAGDDAEEYTTDFRPPLTLNPAEKVRVNVSFAPIGEGRKFAELDIRFDTIVQADPAMNANEASFYRARELEDREEYVTSLNVYENYLENRPVTVNKQRAAIKLPVIREAERYGTGEDFELYLDALNARDDDDHDVAIQLLDSLLLLYPESYIADDALYLAAYIDLMDRDEPAEALQRLSLLRTRYPDTNYYDTGLYAEALAQEKLGNVALARSIYLDLRYRHTSIDALGVTLPKDNIMSRLWFERASEGLEGLSTPS